MMLPTPALLAAQPKERAGFDVQLVKARAAGHAVDQVVCRVDAFKRLREGTRIQGVSDDNLNPVIPRSESVRGCGSGPGRGR